MNQLNNLSVTGSSLVEDKLKYLDEVCSELISQTLRLRDRLEPVLMPDSDDKQNISSGSQPSPPLPQIVQVINMRINDVESILHRVTDTICRLAI